MKASDVRLDLVRIENITGTAFGQSDEAETAKLKAIFNARIVSDLEGLSKGDLFELRLRFAAIIGDEETPSYEIEVAGDFIIEDEHIVKEIKTEAGVYETASLLFPYLRQFSKPILESLGTGNIDFPFYIALPPPTRKKGSSKARADKSA
ncbi:hypothetical protein [Halopseudomonas salina]|uniref:Preprotein translocase subunit SecB n=1 Tax=Halopseudomonas salina TaxID=1323744 RepID=A0ABQ1NYB1_9GAMM|nr:hypothetical protein [Halopseudomonas salina]GGC87230.1 hypothetical protein GCM10007418_03770 [Halopseudomonas salina]